VSTAVLMRCAYCSKLVETWASGPWLWPGKGEVVNCYACAGVMDPAVAEELTKPYRERAKRWLQQYANECEGVDADIETWGGDTPELDAMSSFASDFFADVAHLLGTDRFEAAVEMARVHRAAEREGVI
jgi:hypothetical protein